MTSSAAPKDTGKPRFTPKLMALVAVMVGFFLVFLVFFSHLGLYQIYRLKQEKERLDRENDRLAEDNARLARTIDRLQNDPEMIQDLIRRELNFVKRHEIIIQLPAEGKEQPVKATLIPDKPPSTSQGEVEGTSSGGRKRQTGGAQKKSP